MNKPLSLLFFISLILAYGYPTDGYAGYGYRRGYSTGDTEKDILLGVGALGAAGVVGTIGGIGYVATTQGIKHYKENHSTPMPKDLGEAQTKFNEHKTALDGELELNHMLTTEDKENFKKALEKIQKDPHPHKNLGDYKKKPGKLDKNEHEVLKKVLENPFHEEIAREAKSYHKSFQHLKHYTEPHTHALRE